MTTYHTSDDSITTLSQIVFLGTLGVYGLNDFDLEVRLCEQKKDGSYKTRRKT